MSVMSFQSTWINVNDAFESLVVVYPDYETKFDMQTLEIETNDLIKRASLKITEMSVSQEIRSMIPSKSMESGKNSVMTSNSSYSLHFYNSLRLKEAVRDGELKVKFEYLKGDMDSTIATKRFQIKKELAIANCN